jgi:hypothetical protein
MPTPTIPPPRRGRPQKFGRPSRAVTITLPEDVIDALARIDVDLGRAVVQLAQPLVHDVSPRPAAELANFRDSAVIVIKRLRALERIPGVTLVPLPDGRALISLDETMSVYEFELKLRDVIEETGREDADERAALEAIGEILKAARTNKHIEVHPRRIIVLQSTRHRRIGRQIA